MIVKAPILLDAQMNAVRRLEPASGDLSRNLMPPSTADLTIKAEANSAVPMRSWIRMFDLHGDAGIYRVSASDAEFVTGEQRLTLEHGITSLRDTVVPAPPNPSDDSEIEDTATGMLSYLLEKQNTEYWVAGTCAATENVILNKTGNTLFDMLLEMMDQLPEYDLVLDQSTFPWTVSIASKAQIATAEGRLSRNLSSVRVTYDDSELCTRVRYNVKGNNDEYQMTHMDAAQSYISAYGIVEGSLYLNGDTQDSEATRIAERYLEKRREPAISVEIDAVDLSKATGEPLDAFTVGKLFRLTIPAYGVTVYQWITSVHYGDLYGSPESVTVTLGNRIADIAQRAAKIAKVASEASGMTALTAAKEKDNRIVLEDHNSYIAALEDGISVWRDVSSSLTIDDALVAIFSMTRDLFGANTPAGWAEYYGSQITRLRQAGITVDTSAGGTKPLIDIFASETISGSERISEAETHIEQDAHKISLIASDSQWAALENGERTLIGHMESEFNVQAGQISSKVSQTDYNGNTIASLINQTATTVQIQASKIVLDAVYAYFSGDTTASLMRITDARVSHFGVYSVEDNVTRLINYLPAYLRMGTSIIPSTMILAQTDAGGNPQNIDLQHYHTISAAESQSTPGQIEITLGAVASTAQTTNFNIADTAFYQNAVSAATATERNAWHWETPQSNINPETITAGQITESNGTYTFTSAIATMLAHNGATYAGSTKQLTREVKAQVDVTSAIEDIIENSPGGGIDWSDITVSVLNSGWSAGTYFTPDNGDSYLLPVTATASATDGTTTEVSPGTKNIDVTVVYSDGYAAGYTYGYNRASNPEGVEGSTYVFEYTDRNQTYSITSRGATGTASLSSSFLVYVTQYIDSFSVGSASNNHPFTLDASAIYREGYNDALTGVSIIDDITVGVDDNGWSTGTYYTPNNGDSYLLPVTATAVAGYGTSEKTDTGTTAVDVTNVYQDGYLTGYARGQQDASDEIDVSDLTLPVTLQCAKNNSSQYIVTANAYLKDAQDNTLKTGTNTLNVHYVYEEGWTQGRASAGGATYDLDYQIAYAGSVEVRGTSRDAMVTLDSQLTLYLKTGSQIVQSEGPIGPVISAQYLRQAYQQGYDNGLSAGGGGNFDSLAISWETPLALDENYYDNGFYYWSSTSGANKVVMARIKARAKATIGNTTKHLNSDGDATTTFPVSSVYRQGYSDGDTDGYARAIAEGGTLSCEITSISQNGYDITARGASGAALLSVTATANATYGDRTVPAPDSTVNMNVSGLYRTAYGQGYEDGEAQNAYGTLHNSITQYTASSYEVLTHGSSGTAKISFYAKARAWDNLREQFAETDSGAYLTGSAINGLYRAGYNDGTQATDYAPLSVAIDEPTQRAPTYSGSGLNMTAKIPVDISASARTNNNALTDGDDTTYEVDASAVYRAGYQAGLAAAPGYDGYSIVIGSSDWDAHGSTSNTRDYISASVTATLKGTKSGTTTEIQTFSPVSIRSSGGTPTNVVDVINIKTATITMDAHRNVTSVAIRIEGFGTYRVGTPDSVNVIEP